MYGYSLVFLLALTLAACGGNGGGIDDGQSQSLNSENENSTDATSQSPEATPDTIDTGADEVTEPEVIPPTTEEADNSQVEVPDSPPYGGTIFLDPDIITATDPSTFQNISFQGTAERLMYDRRAGWITTSPYLFQANYDDDLSIEIQVNPEFAEAGAAAEAERYAWLIGQLPTLLRKDVDTSWIHRGVDPWGGGNRNLLIHTGQAALYLEDGIAEETLIHEASHTSLDADYAAAPAWLDAQLADPTFISTYARDNPGREDIAESFLPYVALRYRRDRISDELAAIFEVTMPNRIQFFDSIVRDMYPLE